MNIIVKSLYIEGDNTEEINGLYLFKSILNIVDNIEEADIIYFTSLIDNNNKIKLLHYTLNKRYKNKKIILGPNIEKNPENFYNTLKNVHNNLFINLICDWNINKWNNYKNIPFVKIPMPIDTNKYNISNNSNKNYCFIYIKNRNNEDYNYIIDLFNQTNYILHILNDNNSDEEYINILNNSKFGIWVSNEEIQNIRLLQALSCNIPIIVNDINDDINDINDKTSIPYWDYKNNNTGLVYKNKNDFEQTVRKFMININNFRPRDYIINNFTPEIIFDKYFIF